MESGKESKKNNTKVKKNERRDKDHTSSGRLFDARPTLQAGVG